MYWSEDDFATFFPKLLLVTHQPRIYLSISFVVTRDLSKLSHVPGEMLKMGSSFMCLSISQVSIANARYSLGCEKEGTCVMREMENVKHRHHTTASCACDNHRSPHTHHNQVTCQKLSQYLPCTFLGIKVKGVLKSMLNMDDHIMCLRQPQVTTTRWPVAFVPFHHLLLA